MKVIIAGTRDVATQASVDDAMTAFVTEYCPRIYPKGPTGGSLPGIPAEVVSGGCRGPDQMGEVWAKHRGIPVQLFPADWKLHGKSAGPIRNKRMAEYADALVAIWDGSSHGTANMIGLMRRMGKPTIVWRV